MTKIKSITQKQAGTRRAILLLACFFIFSVAGVSAQGTGATPIPSAGISINSLLRGILGMCSLIFIAFLLSKDRKNISWKTVGIGLSLQLILALGILYVPFMQWFFEFLGKAFVKIMDFTREGTAFLAGDLINTQKVGYIFIFQVLPTILFFSALTSLLYYLNIIQKVVSGIAWCLKKLFGLSGAEGLTVAGNIFLGQCEAPLLAKQYLPSMNRSEMFLVMSAGMATIAGGVMAAYIGMLGGDDPQARIMFAKYLLSASVMAAPGVIVFSKILIPQTAAIDTDIVISRNSVGKNALDAISSGAIQGLKLAVNVAGMILVFIAMIALFNYLLSGLIGHYTGLNAWLSSIMGKPVEFNFQFILGWIFTPIAWLMGVCDADITQVGSLLGTKIVINEFVAYADLSMMKTAGVFLQEKSIIIATFVLCGFANISSIGMQIGGIGALAPDHKITLTKYGFLSMICGALASCMSATIMGMIIG